MPSHQGIRKLIKRCHVDGVDSGGDKAITRLFRRKSLLSGLLAVGAAEAACLAARLALRCLTFG